MRPTSDGGVVVMVPLMIYGSAAGTLAKTDSLRPKFLARTDLGVCATQSSTIKVVLSGYC